MSSKTANQVFVIPSETRHLNELRKSVKELWQACNLPVRDGNLVVLAVDEAVSSIVSHARGTDRRGEVRVAVDIDETRFKATIEDTTNHVDHSHLTDAEMRATLDRERTYQLGLFLIREIMDEVTYTFRRGFQNELELVKFH